MNDKIEVAKLATQLTIATMQSKDGISVAMANNAKRDARSKDQPEALALFDIYFNYIQHRVGE